MLIVRDKDNNKDLSFSLYDMLGAPESEFLTVELIPGLTMVVALRVHPV